MVIEDEPQTEPPSTKNISKTEIITKKNIRLNDSE